MQWQGYEKKIKILCYLRHLIPSEFEIIHMPFKTQVG